MKTKLSQLECNERTNSNEGMSRVYFFVTTVHCQPASPHSNMGSHYTVNCSLTPQSVGQLNYVSGRIYQLAV